MNDCIVNSINWLIKFAQKCIRIKPSFRTWQKAHIVLAPTFRLRAWAIVTVIRFKWFIPKINIVFQHTAGYKIISHSRHYNARLGISCDLDPATDMLPGLSFWKEAPSFAQLVSQTLGPVLFFWRYSTVRSTYTIFPRKNHWLWAFICMTQNTPQSCGSGACLHCYHCPWKWCISKRS